MPETISLSLDAKTLAIMHSVDAFERSQAASPIDLQSFLGDVAAEFRVDVLTELVRVDLERQAERKQRGPLAHYLDLYPELRESKQSVLDLLHAEFELDLAAGKQPDVADYRRIDADFEPPAADTDRSAQPTLSFDGEACPVSVPERVGKYAIICELGSGGFGVVYQAYDEKINRMVALKVRHGGQSGLSEDLLHEARSIAQLDHPNIVRLFDADQTKEGIGYVAYEYVDGETLHAAMSRKDFDRTEAVEWVAQVAEALHYAYGHGNIVHRDIKPANILLDSARRPKVVDFGLARRDEQFFRNDAGQVVGTLAYLSPEQASGDSHWASSQSDLYSLGVVLYELLCHKRPFPANTTAEMLDQILHRSPPPPRSIDDTIPVALEDACLKALAKNPADRFRTGHDMACAVRAAIQPQQSPLARLARYAAAVAAIVALCVLLNSLRTPAATTPNASLPEISSYNLLLADTETPVNDRLPLGPQDRLKVEATLTSPAYAYLLVFDQQARGRLIWPPADEMAQQAKVSRLIYPPLASNDEGVSVPDSDGAMFAVVLATKEPLSRQAIADLVDRPLTLNVAPEIAAQARTSFQVAEPAPKFHQGIPTRDGQRATDLRFPDSLRQALSEHSDMFVGNLVPHAKSAPPVAK